MVVRDTAVAVVLYAENPLWKGADYPNFGTAGILRCAKGRAEATCNTDRYDRLRGLPVGQIGGDSGDALE
jgi:hypothetical protein